MVIVVIVGEVVGHIIVFGVVISPVVLWFGDRSRLAPAAAPLRSAAISTRTGRCHHRRLERRRVLHDTALIALVGVRVIVVILAGTDLIVLVSKIPLWGICGGRMFVSRLLPLVHKRRRRFRRGPRFVLVEPSSVGQDVFRDVPIGLILVGFVGSLRRVHVLEMCLFLIGGVEIVLTRSSANVLAT